MQDKTHRNRKKYMATTFFLHGERAQSGLHFCTFRHSKNCFELCCSGGGKLIHGNLFFPFIINCTILFGTPDADFQESCVILLHFRRNPFFLFSSRIKLIFLFYETKSYLKRKRSSWLKTNSMQRIFMLHISVRFHGHRPLPIP